jgi:hypothetical protein
LQLHRSFTGSFAEASQKLHRSFTEASQKLRELGFEPKELAPSLRSWLDPMELALSQWSWLRAYGADSEPKELGSEPKELA